MPLTGVRQRGLPLKLSDCSRHESKSHSLDVATRMRLAPNWVLTKHVRARGWLVNHNDQSCEISLTKLAAVQRRLHAPVSLLPVYDGAYGPM